MRQELEQELLDILDDDDPLRAKLNQMSIAKLQEELKLRLQVLVSSKPIDLSHLKLMPSAFLHLNDPAVIHFGKHKGTKWAELPLDYLVWLYEAGVEDAKPHLVKRGFFKRLNATVLSCHSKQKAKALLTKLEWTLTPKQKQHLMMLLSTHSPITNCK